MISILTSIAHAADAAAPAAKTGKGGTFGFFLPMIMVFAIFYFLLIRPQQKQQKKLKEMLSSIRVGDEVVTSAGIHGKVTQIEDKTLTVEIANNVRIKMERGSVARLKNQPNQSVEPTKSK